MNDTEKRQAADFLSIALECIEDGSHDVAVDFIEDVADDSDEFEEELRGAVERLEDGDIEEAHRRVEGVSTELVSQLDDI